MANVAKAENGYLIASSRNILNKWYSYIRQLLNVRCVDVIRHNAVHTAEPWLPESSFVELEIGDEEVKGYKFRSIDQIPSEFIEAEFWTTWSKLHKFIRFIWNKVELPQ
jgi:hypothetical protein